MKIFFAYIVIAASFFSKNLYSQDSSVLQFQTETFSLADSSRNFILQKPFVIESSIKIFLDSIQIKDRNAYFFDRITNTITFLNRIQAEKIFISYNYISLELRKPYSLRSLQIRKNTENKNVQIYIAASNESIFTNVFGNELSKSGSITRGFTVGTNRELTVNSGFRLQMAGKLSDDIEILAALTDENIPIQPQGNTQTLQELDNVFVEIKHPTYSATLGDFYFNSTVGEFSSINRKLQGAKVGAEYSWEKNKTTLSLVGATSRGKFHSNQFAGIEGVQGPYRLTGKNNERNIIVLAGTERVYVDGQLMIRGENNDYAIDYGSAEISFSTRRLITSASRIVVDFEYSDRQFTRNFAGTTITSEISKKISLYANYFQESDDIDAPIDISLSDDDKKILERSGNSSALKNGVTFVGRDSLGIGKGNYAKSDTVISGDTISLYRYRPSTIDALYNVAFTNVGAGRGDYNRLAPGQYNFVGIKSGTYLPIIILPSAQLQQNVSVGISAKPFEELSIIGDFAFSKFDPNRFSSAPLQEGKALKFVIQYAPKTLVVSETNLGSLQFNFSERIKDKNFITLDRFDDVEFGRKWSTDSIRSAAVFDEEIREGKILYSPIEGISINTEAGMLNRENQISTNRYAAFVNITQLHSFSGSYSVENIANKENISKTRNNWFRNRGNMEYTFSSVTPSFRFERENRMMYSILSDTLLTPSFSYFSYAPKIKLASFYGIDFASEFEWRNDDGTKNGEILPQSKSFTQLYEISLREMSDFSISSSIIVREKKYEKDFTINYVNQNTILLKNQARYRPLAQAIDIDWYYDVATQRTARLERVFYKVRKGEGQYVWVDANENGKVDVYDEKEFRADRYEGEYILLTITGDQLFPIINLKTSSRFRFTPSRIFNSAISTFDKVISAISTESFVRIEERSSEANTERIYFINMKYFLNPTTTLMGNQFLQQDVFLFEQNPEFSLRFRFNQRKGLSQYASGLEQNYLRERSIRARFQISNDIYNQTDYINKKDNAVSSSLINQPRQIFSNGIISDFSYRPERNIELGIKIENSSSIDNFISAKINSDFNSQTVRIVYSLAGNGQFKTELSREEIIISNKPSNYSFPYELTSGRDEGKIFLWSQSAEYRMGSNVQFLLYYTGRTHPRLNVIHTGRMEVRAFF